MFEWFIRSFQQRLKSIIGFPFPPANVFITAADKFIFKNIFGNIIS